MFHSLGDRVPQLIGAGHFVAPNEKIVRQITAEEIDWMKGNADHYAQNAPLFARPARISMMGD